MIRACKSYDERPLLGSSESLRKEVVNYQKRDFDKESLRVYFFIGNTFCKDLGVLLAQY